MPKVPAKLLDLPQTNFVATSDPTVSDDDTAGYAVGSKWINTTSDEGFLCVDASTGAAIWLTTTTAGAGATDHGALTGLGDDDHTQYLLADGTRDLVIAHSAANYTPGSAVLEEHLAGIDTALGSVGGGGEVVPDATSALQWHLVEPRDFSQYIDGFSNEWLNNSSSGSLTRGSGEIGVHNPLILRTGTGATSYQAISSQGQGTFGAKFLYSFGVIFKVGVVPTGSVDHRFRMGWIDDIRHGGSPYCGVYLAMERAENSTNFVGVTLDQGSKTTTDLGVAFVANTWYAGRIIVNGDGTSVDFEVRALGTAFSSPSTVATNIPTTASFPMYHGLENSKVSGTGARELKSIGWEMHRRAA